MSDYINTTVSLSVDTHKPLTFEILRQADAELRIFFAKRPLLTELRVNPEDWARVKDEIQGAVAVHGFSPPRGGFFRIDILPDPEVPLGTFKPVYHAE